MTLDVERLATQAVEAAVDRAARLAEARGSEVRLTTDLPLIAGSFAAVENLRVDGRPTTPWAPLSGFVEATDGWVRLHANYPHHAAALRSALRIESREDLDRVCRTLPAEEIEDAVVAAGGIATAVRTEEQWDAHPHARATAGLPWVSERPAEAREPLGSAYLPLEGVRVLDLTRVIAGPTCSQLLACLGADVLRVDPPQRPELLDAFLSNGMGKRSAELDLTTALPRLHALLDEADVVLLGYRPGALDRFGLDPDTLVAERPRLVVGALSAWDRIGPWGGRAGFDSIVQAATGIAVVEGEPGGRPGALPVQALDHATGHRLAAGVMGMLAAGTGGVVRASLLGAARELLSGPRTAAEGPWGLPVPLVTVASAYGDLTAVPPPVRIDGRTAERPVARYGSSALTWLR